MMFVRGWFVTTLQKSLDLFFLFQLRRAFRVHLLHLCQFFRSDRGKMPDKMDKFPAVFILSAFTLVAECRHSGKADSIVNDVKDLAVCQALRIRLSHVRRFWIQALAYLRLAASVIRVARRTVIGEVSHGLG